MILDDAILGRRSIRRYRPEPVSDTVVHEVLDLARYAPSSMGGQPWEFIVVDDRAVLTALGKIKDRYCPPEKRAFKADMFASAPLAILVCVDMHRSYGRALENGVLATAYLMLAAHSRGLGTVYISASSADDPRLAKEIRELLRIPDDIVPVTIVPLGYPEELPEPKTMRELKILRDAYAEDSADNVPKEDKGVD